MPLSIADVDAVAGIITLDDGSRWSVTTATLPVIRMWLATHRVSLFGEGTFRRMTNQDYGSVVRVVPFG